MELRYGPVPKVLFTLSHLGLGLEGLTHQRHTPQPFE